jgi:hypothetical protein
MGKEYIGTIYNHWKILDWIEPHKRANPRKAYIAQCDCGNITEVRIDDLKNGKSRKCRQCTEINGQLVNYHLEIKINEKYNSLLILDYLRDEKDGRYKFLCRCDCGKEVLKRPVDIYTENTKSCGCLFEKNFSQLEERIGEKFGKLTIIEMSDRKDPQGKRRYRFCQCECGNIVEVSISHLVAGHTQSCGCISSLGEEWVRAFLEEKEISFIRQYMHLDLVYIKPLKIDFALIREDIIYGFIEVMGRQHYDKNSRFYSEENVKRDQVKKEFCIKRGIPVLYLNYDKISFLKEPEKWQKQLMEFINATRI